MRKIFILSMMMIALMLQLKASSCSCPSGPLSPCSWNFSVRGGIEPGLYPDKRRNDFVNHFCVNAVKSKYICTEIIFEHETEFGRQVDTVRTPKFSSQFDLPWTVIGDLGFALSCNTELFFDGYYGEARGRSNSYNLFYRPVATDVFDFPIKPREFYSLKEKYSSLSYLGGDIGLRYFFPGTCGCGNFFIGAKAGVRHYDPVRVTIKGTRNKCDLDKVSHALYYDSYNVVSTGLQIGFDARICRCLHFVIVAEAIGTCGLKSHKLKPTYNISEFVREEIEDEIESFGYFTELSIPSRRTYNVLSFPITAGLRFEF